MMTMLFQRLREKSSILLPIKFILLILLFLILFSNLCRIVNNLNSDTTGLIPTSIPTFPILGKLRAK